MYGAKGFLVVLVGILTPPPPPQALRDNRELSFACAAFSLSRASKIQKAEIFTETLASQATEFPVTLFLC